MTKESDSGSMLEVLGGLIAHAQTAQAALDAGIAAQDDNTEAITELIKQAAGVVQRLQAEVQKIGSRAEQAGAAAVRDAIQQNLAGAGAVVAEAARAHRVQRVVFASSSAVYGDARHTDVLVTAGVRHADTLIVADGTSCRHQIHDGAGREAIHVARVLAQAL